MFQMNLWPVFTCRHLTLISQSWPMSRPNTWALARLVPSNPATIGKDRHAKMYTFHFFCSDIYQMFFYIGINHPSIKTEDVLWVSPLSCRHGWPLQVVSYYYRETVDNARTHTFFSSQDICLMSTFASSCNYQKAKYYHSEFWNYQQVVSNKLNNSW